MKKLSAVILMFIAVGMVWAGPAASADRVAELMPDFVLPLPESPDEVAYLGLKDIKGETFKVSDIDADILLIELFSMYCPYCQEEAPLVNELYEMMKDSEQSGRKMKLIGIGASNSWFEVNHFRDTFKVKFPVFPDKDMSIYNALSGAGTPGFIGIRFDEDGKGVIVLRQSGGFYSSDEFLAELISYATNQ